MSLILEALRKSEAERRRGLPPDLRTELPPAARPSRGAFPAWGWIALALALAALALGFWMRMPSRSTGDAPASQPASRTAADVAAASPASRGASDAPARLPDRTPASPADPPAGTASAREPEADPASVVQIANTEPPSAVATPRQDRAEPDTPTPLPVAPPVTSTDDAVPAPPASRRATGDRVLDIAELDPDTRQALPPLKLSMHLWNEDAARRFVILDGRRLGEGDRIGEASIVRIERDGVLLEWQGRGIRIPVR